MIKLKNHEVELGPSLLLGREGGRRPGFGTRGSRRNLSFEYGCFTFFQLQWMNVLWITASLAGVMTSGQFDGWNEIPLISHISLLSSEIGTLTYWKISHLSYAISLSYLSGNTLSVHTLCPFFSWTVFGFNFKWLIGIPYIFLTRDMDLLRFSNIFFQSVIYLLTLFKVMFS